MGEGFLPPSILGQQPLAKLTFWDCNFPRVGRYNEWMVPGLWNSCEQMDVIQDEESQLSDGTTCDKIRSSVFTGSNLSDLRHGSECKVPSERFGKWQRKRDWPQEQFWEPS